VSVTTTSPETVPAGAPADGAPATPPEWQVWAALWIVYLVWGSTYLAIRVTVETVPPFLSAGARFSFAGAAMLAFLAIRRGPSVLRPTRAQLLSCLAAGTLLMGANAVVSVAEVDGAIHAAIQLDDGLVFANPFLPTTGLVALLELRGGVGAAKRRRARRGLAERLGLRPAPRARAA